MKSIMQVEKECWMCRRLFDDINLPKYGLEEHHVFPGTANRKKSEQYGLKVWLCPMHHRLGVHAAHRCHETMTILQIEGQKAFEREYSHETFMKEFGKDYIGIQEIEWWKDEGFFD